MSDTEPISDSSIPIERQNTDRLLEELYTELRQLAAARLAKEPDGQTLQPTALVHEAWMKLQALDKQEWNHRGHFFGAAAEAMRRILIDRARKRGRRRHGAGWRRVDLNTVELAFTTDEEILLDMDDALERFGQTSPREAELVKLRFFGGLTLAEAASAQGISLATAKRHWVYARAWLLDDLQRGGRDQDSDGVE